MMELTTEVVIDYVTRTQTISLSSLYVLDPRFKKLKTSTLESLYVVSQSKNHGGLGILIGSFYPSGEGMQLMGKKGNPLEDQLHFAPVIGVGLSESDAELVGDKTQDYHERKKVYIDFLVGESKEDGFILIDRSRQIIASRVYIPIPTPDVNISGHARHIAADYAARNLTQVATAIVLSEEDHRITVFEDGKSELWLPEDSNPQI